MIGPALVAAKTIDGHGQGDDGIGSENDDEHHDTDGADADEERDHDEE